MVGVPDADHGQRFAAVDANRHAEQDVKLAVGEVDVLRFEDAAAVDRDLLREVDVHSAH